MQGGVCGAQELGEDSSDSDAKWDDDSEDDHASLAHHIMDKVHWKEVIKDKQLDWIGLEWVMMQRHACLWNEHKGANHMIG
jgi:hypothetical protein